MGQVCNNAYLYIDYEDYLYSLFLLHATLKNISHDLKCDSDKYMVEIHIFHQISGKYFT